MRNGGRYIPVVAVMVLLLIVSGCTETPLPAPATTPVPIATVPVTTPPPAILPAITSAIPTLPPYPDVLSLNVPFVFGNGTKWPSVATVTRIWINDTYRWWDPDFNVYTPRTAPPGKKYLVLFLTMVNRGTERAPLPQPGNIIVIYNNIRISQDPTHILPTATPDSPPKIFRIAEIEYSHKIYSSEYIEDYGYSHGQKLSHINPGLSNAVEGYIFYEVPESLVPGEAYVLAGFPSGESAIWRLG